MLATDSCFAKAILVRLFRVWSMAREEGTMGLAPVYSLAADLRLPDETALACASLFELVEGELGRPLKRESCCARTFSSDEVALLGLVEAAPALNGVSGSRAVPHGLSGAIRWAVMAVRRALAWQNGTEKDDSQESVPPEEHCCWVAIPSTRRVILRGE
ncbi:hypothetical protein [Qipengyuania sp. MTN3-11]|uniref:hypothetical protein n=1 Tax=Qipengyuania sp. MTN3-11 TaxID=3056557 RepID=UPI0036F200E7